MRFLSLARLRSPLLALATLAAPFVLGCGKGATPGPDAPAPSVSGDAAPGEEDSAEAETTVVESEAPVAVASDEPIRRIVDGEGYDLSIEREIPNLRAGDARATVGVPKKWVLPSRRPEYVIWFAEKLGQEFPRILVTSEPAPAGTPDTTEANVRELEAQVVSRVTDAIEEPMALIIGGVPCVRYVTAAKSSRTDLEEQVLETVQGGQLFKINLQAPVTTEGESPLPTYRDKGYAVLASLKVEKTEAPAEPAEPPAAAEPAPDAAAPAPAEATLPAN